VRVDLDGENMEDGKHLPTQKNQRNDGHGDGQDLAKIEIAAARLEAPCDQAKNIQRSEAKNQHPEEVVDIVLFAGQFLGKLEREEQ
jgi:hypothetical protein